MGKKTNKTKDKNWLLISYSMEIICKLFKDACLYFSSVQNYSDDWLSDEDSQALMYRFGMSKFVDMIIMKITDFLLAKKDIRKALEQSITKKRFLYRYCYWIKRNKSNILFT